MKAILENPYRVIGLLVGANAKEKEKKVRRLKQYIEAEQEPDADDSFSEKIPVVRTISSLPNHYPLGYDATLIIKYSECYIKKK